ncbi:minichromosome maintenance protein MCM [Candidatus Hecatella orcuttiae]|jgi:replicative DNA helicase Mcm|uniref:minichromosome maintenance protein MCM n=1 Tax=Candidatus Hecatella orcuttiae TaxID=1935119 RepID=UPI002867CFAC|nr:minichromosome maintenance protein MCM [Candidatus Hecatella orcuttiae]
MARVLVDPLEKFQELFKKPEYRKMMKKMAVEEKRSLYLDFVDLSLFSKELASMLVEKPEECLKQASLALQAQMRIEDAQYSETAGKLYVRVKGLPHKVPLRSIGAKHIEKMASFDGIVVRSTPIKPLLMEAIFKCKCGEEMTIPQHGPFLRQPSRCMNPSCRRESGFELIPEKSKFMDFQELRVQERPEELPPGQLPRHLDVVLEDDVVDCARPGDRVVVTGIVRARPEVVPGKGRLRAFNIFVDANSVETLGKELETLDLSLEDEKKILELSKDAFIHKKIVDSIAPSIFGYEDIKEAIMYLLFGGVPKVTPEGVTIRGDVHILLVGDPGTAKSQMLRYVSRVSPRGLYTSGRGTTAAGLTAAVLREKAGGMVLEAGALVLADKGVAAVDEIDKMRDEDRVAMHEMMEQQTVSVAKGGIVATLNARTSIMAAANPKLGRYEDRLSVAENINIPLVILSRFDLIFIQRDLPDKDLDDRLADHILRSHRAGGAEASPIPPELLRKYITYARSRVTPKLSQEAAEHLKQFYLKMRERSGGAEGSPIAITPRQLEALVRISEARARAALREEVTAVDAEAAIQIMKKSLQAVGALGAEAGDIDIIMTGRPATVREGIASVLMLVGEMEKKFEEVELEELYRRLEEEYNIERRAAEEYVRKMISQGLLYSPRTGYVKKARG